MLSAWELGGFEAVRAMVRAAMAGELGIAPTQLEEVSALVSVLADPRDRRSQVMSRVQGAIHNSMVPYMHIGMNEEQKLRARIAGYAGAQAVLFSMGVLACDAVVGEDLKVVFDDAKLQRVIAAIRGGTYENPA
jgi:hypothetical protein